MEIRARGVITALGLMSGTSMDAIDLAILKTDGESILTFGPVSEAPFSAEERVLLREAMADAKGIEKHGDRSGVIAIAETILTEKHTRAVKDFLGAHDLRPQDIGVIGFHGQTVIHRPERGLTVQLGDGPTLADATGVPVVYNFRAADMAAGGQGAPFAPAYHRALADMADLPRPLAVVNLGGVANVTWIGEDGDLLAFDTGPGNALIDDWMLRRTGAAMDNDGNAARSGVVSQLALEEMLRHVYFTAPAPKSLDRNAFSMEPVESLSVEDGAATLTAFTAATLAHASKQFPAPPKRWVLIGGGARNPALVEVIRRVIQADIMTGDDAGWRSEAIEAQAFAYLAVRSMYGLPLSFPGTTGVNALQTGGVLVKPRT
ncbi:MAG: anhydro-N-acetylmuramic acid kinase [Chitinophagales bacterium]|nr:anhydro-N-acetylmuramic acid kinase [Hyphomicrobiales bacterium]